MEDLDYEEEGPGTTTNPWDSSDGEEEDESVHDWLAESDATETRSLRSEAASTLDPAESMDQRATQLEDFMSGVAHLYWQHLSEEQRQLMLADLEDEWIRPGESAVLQGDRGDSFFFVFGPPSAEMAVTVCKDDAEKAEQADPTKILRTHLGVGSYFGEGALINGPGAPRSATVSAATPEQVLDSAKVAPAVHLLRVDAANFAHWECWRQQLIVKDVPLMMDLSPKQRLGIASRFVRCDFPLGENIVRQHDTGDKFYIIVKGAAEVVDEDKGKILTNLYPGHQFGEVALLYDSPRNATVRAASEVTVCLSLSKTDFRDALEKEDGFAECMDAAAHRIATLREQRGQAAGDESSVSAVSTQSTPPPSPPAASPPAIGSDGDGLSPVAGMSESFRSKRRFPSGSDNSLDSDYSNSAALLPPPSAALPPHRGGDRAAAASFAANNIRNYELLDDGIGKGTYATVYSAKVHRSFRSDGSSSEKGKGGRASSSLSLSPERARGPTHRKSASTMAQEPENLSEAPIPLPPRSLSPRSPRFSRSPKSLVRRSLSGAELVALKFVTRGHGMRRKRVNAAVAAEERVCRWLGRHPNLVSLYNVIDDPLAPGICIVMELCSGGTLNEVMGEAEARKCFRQVLLGVKYMHGMLVAHGDIKPDNLLRKRDKSDADPLIKICDFGSARILSPDTLQAASVDVHRAKSPDEPSPVPSPTSSAGNPDGQGGAADRTPIFTAPEVYASRDTEEDAKDAPPQDERCADIWALGVTLFFWIFGSYPWHGKNELLLSYRLAKVELTFPEGPDGTLGSPHARDLLRRMLDKNPRTRATAEQIAMHEWVTNEGSEPLLDPTAPQGHNSPSPVHNLRMGSGSSTSSAFMAVSDGVAPPPFRRPVGGSNISNGSDSSSEFSALLSDPEEDMLSVNGREIRRASNDATFAGLNSSEEAFFRMRRPALKCWTDRQRLSLGSCPGVRIGLSAKKGRRKTMEDHTTLILATEENYPQTPSARAAPPGVFCGVYDGHGGTRAAEALGKELHSAIWSGRAFPQDMRQAIRDACCILDAAILDAEMEHQERAGPPRSLGRGSEQEMPGSCALFCHAMAAEDGAIDLWLGSVGDSKAVVSRGGEAEVIFPTHSVANEDEVQRVDRRGGVVHKGRLFGCVAVTRAFGDLKIKQYMAPRKSMLPEDPREESPKHAYNPPISPRRFFRRSGKQSPKAAGRTSSSEQLRGRGRSPFPLSPRRLKADVRKFSAGAELVRQLWESDSLISEPDVRHLRISADPFAVDDEEEEVETLWRASQANGQGSDAAIAEMMEGGQREQAVEFLVLACDGLWDVMEPQECVNFVRRRLVNHGDLQRCSRDLVEAAVDLGSEDNVSAAIIFFGQK